MDQHSSFCPQAIVLDSLEVVIKSTILQTHSFKTKIEIWGRSLSSSLSFTIVFQYATQHGILVDLHCSNSFLIILQCICFKTHCWCYFIEDYITAKFDLPSGIIHQFISFKIYVIPNKHAFGAFGFQICFCLGWPPSIIYASKDLKMTNLRFLPTPSLLWCLTINYLVKTPHFQIHRCVDDFSLGLHTNISLMKH